MVSYGELCSIIEPVGAALRAVFGQPRLIASVLHAASFLGLAAARASCRNGHQPVIDVFRS